MLIPASRIGSVDSQLDDIEDIALTVGALPTEQLELVVGAVSENPVVDNNTECYFDSCV